MPKFATHVHDDGRTCRQDSTQGPGSPWHFKSTSDGLSKVVSAKPFVDRCDRSHAKEG